jgi:hypothetical protein
LIWSTAAALLAFGGGCVTPTAAKKPAAEPPVAKPDVLKPGVLPPPQDVMKPAAAAPAAPGVVPAAAKVPAPIAADVPITPPGAARAAAPAGPALKLPGLSAATKPVPATDLGVGWRNRIAYLPDPTRNGAMGPGLAGQMFLFGGPKSEHVLADGTLTVDLVDDTPRPPGQPAAKAERWQFDKHTLRKLQAYDETFGKSYVLFLPWPEYKPDITRVRISARYDPDGDGHTLYQAPATLTIDTSAPLGAQPVWDGAATNTPLGAPKPLSPQPIAPGVGPQPLSPSVAPLGPLPVGGPPAAVPTGATLDGQPPIAIGR